MRLSEYIFPAIPMLRKMKTWDYQNNNYHCEVTFCNVRLKGNWTFIQGEDYLPKMQGTLMNYNSFTVETQQWRKFISGEEHHVGKSFKVFPGESYQLEVWRYDTFPMQEILPVIGGKGDLGVLKPNQKKGRLSSNVEMYCD
jgi:hypothetical protein